MGPRGGTIFQIFYSIGLSRPWGKTTFFRRRFLLGYYLGPCQVNKNRVCLINKMKKWIKELTTRNDFVFIFIFVCVILNILFFRFFPVKGRESPSQEFWISRRDICLARQFSCFYRRGSLYPIFPTLGRTITSKDKHV